MLLRIATLVPVALALLLVAGAVSLLIWPHRLLGVGGETLAHSLQQEIGFTDGRSRCKERDREFVCVVGDPTSSLDPRYLVRLEDDCWRARRPEQRPGRARLRGCIGIDDYVRIPGL